MAAVPDFGSLATQQKSANDQATNQTNLANRPNQYDPLGSITWSMNPDGTWGQSTNMSAEGTNAYWASMNGQTGLAGQIGAGLNQSGLPASARPTSPAAWVRCHRWVATTSKSSTR